MVGEVFGLRRGVTGGTKAEHWLVDLLLDDRFELGLFIGVAGELTIAPFHSEVVIGAYLRKQGRAITGLGDVVETRVVHYGGRGAVLLGPVGVAQLLDSVARRRFHIVRESELETIVKQQIDEPMFRFGLRRGVTGGTKAEHWLVDLLLDDRFELGLFIGVAGELTIAPFHSEVVIGAYLRKQGRAITGLGDVVETRVVHYGGRGAVLLGPVGVAQLLDSVARRRFHIVRESERVADLMRHHEPNELTDKVVGKRKILGTFVHGGGLNEVPVAHEPLHVVEHTDVGF